MPSRERTDGRYMAGWREDWDARHCDGCGQEFDEAEYGRALCVSCMVARTEGPYPAGSVLESILRTDGPEAAEEAEAHHTRECRWVLNRPSGECWCLELRRLRDA